MFESRKKYRFLRQARAGVPTRSRLRARTLIVTAACVLIAVATLGTSAQNAPSPLPAPTGFVNDFANVIDAQTKSRLETILTNLKQQQNIEIAVITVPTTNDEAIFDYALSIARRWGIGSKDGEKLGVLLVLAINDRKYNTQVSRHLEGDLPDGVTGQIQRERLVPQLRKGNYSQGISDTIQAYIATLAEQRNFSIEGIDKSYAQRADRGNTEPRRGRPAGGGGGSFSSFGSCCLIIIVILVIIAVLSSARRGGGSGCLNALLLGSLFSSLSGGGRGGSSSGWGGGGFGGGGGGFGGFGGGGDFGGGGSGGSW